jgi:xylose isomerase
MEDSRINELELPTLAKGESWKDLTSVNVDVDGLAARGYQYETIDQLAIEHLMGL